VGEEEVEFVRLEVSKVLYVANMCDAAVHVGIADYREATADPLCKVDTQTRRPVGGWVDPWVDPWVARRWTRRWTRMSTVDPYTRTPVHQ
jgi:hypothetical protein